MQKQLQEQQQQQSQEVTPDKLINIIGLKEVEITFLREQLVALQQENAILKDKDNKKK